MFTKPTSLLALSTSLYGSSDFIAHRLSLVYTVSFSIKYLQKSKSCTNSLTWKFRLHWTTAQELTIRNELGPWKLRLTSEPWIATILNPVSFKVRSARSYMTHLVFQIRMHQEQTTMTQMLVLRLLNQMLSEPWNWIMCWMLSTRNVWEATPGFS